MTEETTDDGIIIEVDGFDEFSSPRRTALGQFAPGHSGNPTGRPKGSKSFSTMVTDALATELKAEDGSKLTIKEYMSQVVAGILVNGTYKTIDGEEIVIRSADLLPFLLQVWKKLEPTTTNLDITSGGERLDFNRLDDNELRKFIEGGVAAALVSGRGSGEAGTDLADSEPEDSPSGLPSEDPA